jgi:hypothetical protein
MCSGTVARNIEAAQEPKRETTNNRIFSFFLLLFSAARCVADEMGKTAELLLLLSHPSCPPEGLLAIINGDEENCTADMSMKMSQSQAASSQAASKIGIRDDPRCAIDLCPVEFAS